MERITKSKELNTKFEKFKINITKFNANFIFGGINLSLIQKSGDCWFIINNIKCELIIFDCGYHKKNENIVKNIIFKMIDEYRIKNIKIIISHNDQDHSKGIISLIRILTEFKSKLEIEIFLPIEFLYIEYLNRNYKSKVIKGISQILHEIKDKYSKNLKIEIFKKSQNKYYEFIKKQKKGIKKEKYEIKEFFLSKEIKSQNRSKQFDETYNYEFNDSIKRLEKTIRKELKVKTNNISKIIKYCLQNNIVINPFRSFSNYICKPSLQLYNDSIYTISLPNSEETDFIPLLPEKVDSENIAMLFMACVNITNENKFSAILSVTKNNNIIALFAADSVLECYKKKSIDASYMKIFVYPHHGSISNQNCLNKFFYDSPYNILWSYNFGVTQQIESYPIEGFELEENFRTYRFCLKEFNDIIYYISE